MSTRALPFGPDVDTLVLCKNATHRASVIEALGIRARYELLFSALTGYRFKKIIVIGATPESAAEAAALDRLINEDLPTHLDRDGSLHVI